MKILCLDVGNKRIGMAVSMNLVLPPKVLEVAKNRFTARHK